MCFSFLYPFIKKKREGRNEGRKEKEGKGSKQADKKEKKEGRRRKEKEGRRREGGREGGKWLTQEF
ncbi:Nucleolar protein 58, partial [Ophiophagus hannah]